MWVPLHVTDAPDGLHLGGTGSELIEMLEFALLQQVLVATVAGELVSHKPGTMTRRRSEKEQEGVRRSKKDLPNVCTWEMFGGGGVGQDRENFKVVISEEKGQIKTNHG